jgi:hypothetical protein
MSSSSGRRVSELVITRPTPSIATINTAISQCSTRRLMAKRSGCALMAWPPLPGAAPAAGGSRIGRRPPSGRQDRVGRDRDAVRNHGGVKIDAIAVTALLGLHGIDPQRAGIDRAPLLRPGDGRVFQHITRLGQLQLQGPADRTLGQASGQLGTQVIGRCLLALLLAHALCLGQWYERPAQRGALAISRR